MEEEGKAVTLKVVYGILSFLEEEMKNPTLSKGNKEEGLEVAIQCIETAFGIGLKDEQYKPPVSLRELMGRVGVEKGTAVESGDTEPVNSEAQNPSAKVAPDAPPTFTNPSPLGGQRSVNLGGPVYIRPPEPSDEDRKLANIAKDKGNEAMKNSKVTEGLEYYTKAIELDGNNPTYFCNRAAAYIKLEDFDKAIRDCQIAIQLKPDYARAYGRMGVINSTLGKHLDAIICYRKALELEPETESYRNNLQVSQRLMMQQSFAGVQAQAASTPSLQTLLNNPTFINVATNLLQEPTMQELLSNFMRSFQNGGVGSGAAGIGQMEGLMQMGLAVAQQMENASPQLSEQLISLSGQNENPSPAPENSEASKPSEDAQPQESAERVPVQLDIVDIDNNNDHEESNEP